MHGQPHIRFRHITVLISKRISKIMNPFTSLKNLSPFHFTSLFIFYYFCHLSYQPFTSLYFAIHILNSLPFTELSFIFHFLSPDVQANSFSCRISAKIRISNFMNILPGFPVPFSLAERQIGLSVDKKNQLDVTLCILYFSSNSCSTCFGQPCAHHQELMTA